MVVTTSKDIPLAERRLLRSLVKNTDGFMARARRSAYFIANFAPFGAYRRKANSDHHDLDRHWLVRRAVLPVRAVVLANRGGAAVPAPFDRGWMRRRAGEAETSGDRGSAASSISGETISSTSAFLHASPSVGRALQPRLGHCCSALRQLPEPWDRPASYIGDRCASGMAAARCLPRSRLLPMTTWRGRSMPPHVRGVFIYLVPILALFGKSSWFLFAASLGAPIFFCLLIFLAVRERLQSRRTLAAASSLSQITQLLDRHGRDVNPAALAQRGPRCPAIHALAPA